MTNKEFYKDEIMDMAIKGDRIAIAKITGKPCSCLDIQCDDCLLSNNHEAIGCSTERAKWANEEYKPPASRYYVGEFKE